MTSNTQQSHMENDTIVSPKKIDTALKQFGNYKLIRSLGEGSYATVYLARDPLDRSVALKILKKQYSFNDTFLEQFKREAQTAARLNHEHIITIFEQGEIEGQFYIAMEYAPQGTLLDLIQRQEGEGITRTDIKNIVTQVADALDFAHSNNVIHRDIKPSNILLSYSNKVKLADFGIARAEESGTTGVSTSVKGTFAYMAPEQANPSGKVDGRTDVYALAIVVYELLSGRLPFDDEGGDFASLIQNKRRARFINHLQDVPTYVSKTIFDALRPDRDDRPRTAGEFAKHFLNSVQQWERSTAENRDKQDLAGMAFLAMEQGHWNEAKAHWKTLLRFGKSILAEENLQKVEREISLQNAWTKVSESFGKAEWEAAIAALNEIRRIDPDNAEAPAKLKEARQQIHWQELYERGQNAFAQEDYAVAVETFTKIFEENPEYRDVQARLEEFRQNQIKDELNRMREMTLISLAEGDLETAAQFVAKIKNLVPTMQFGVASFLERYHDLVDKIGRDRQQIEQNIKTLRSELGKHQKQVAQQQEEISKLTQQLEKQSTSLAQQHRQLQQQQTQMESLRQELIQRLYQYLEDLDYAVEALNANLLTRKVARELIAHLRKRILEIAARGEQLEESK